LWRHMAHVLRPRAAIKRRRRLRRTDGRWTQPGSLLMKFLRAHPNSYLSHSFLCAKFTTSLSEPRSRVSRKCGVASMPIRAPAREIVNNFLELFVEGHSERVSFVCVSRTDANGNRLSRVGYALLHSKLLRNQGTFTQKNGTLKLKHWNLFLKVQYFNVLFGV
jgi:hypothetical protein